MSPDGNEDSAALLAKVVSKDFAGHRVGQWQRLSVDAEVAAGQKLVVGPTFRTTLVTRIPSLPDRSCCSGPDRRYESLKECI